MLATNHTKACSRCAVEHQLSHFHSDRSKADGHYTICRTCTRAKDLERYPVRRAAVEEYRRSYYKKNSDVIRAKSAKWYEENKDRAHKNSKSWALKYPERRRAIAKKCDDARRAAQKKPKLVLTHKTCTRCMATQPLEAFHRSGKNGRRAMCKPCNNAASIAWGKLNKDKRDASGKRYRLKHADKVRSGNKRRHDRWYKENTSRAIATARLHQMRRRSAVPLWANKKAISEFYKEAKRLTIETGIRHDVDHIVPIKSKFVCGLHVEHNLRVIPYLENLKKLNRWRPEMPEGQWL